jgi:peptidoglycan/LPS O-acetylase OafA/YrhL
MLLVFLLHYSVVLPANLWPLSEEGGLALFRNGYYGVTSFFVISGFLIAGNTKRRYGGLPSVSIREFYIMRASRILPLFFLFLLVLSALGYAGAAGFAELPDHPIGQMIWYAVTLRFNLYYLYHSGYQVFPWSLLWSLSIEEAFYLAFPIYCKISRKTLVVILGFSGLFIYGIYYRSVPNSLWDYFSCVDGMALGGLAAVALRPLPRLASSVLAAFGLTLIFSVYWGPAVADNAVWGPALVALGTALLLLACGADPAPMPTGLRIISAPLRAVGEYSYECYLLHASVIIAVQQQWFGNWGSIPYLCLAVTFGTMLALAMALGWGFGEPANRWLRRALTGLGKSEVRPPAVAAGADARLRS